MPVTKAPAEPSVALDRAGITVFRDITFLAAGPASERSRSACSFSSSGRQPPGGQPMSQKLSSRWPETWARLGVKADDRLTSPVLRLTVLGEGGSTRREVAASRRTQGPR